MGCGGSNESRSADKPAPAVTTKKKKKRRSFGAAHEGISTDKDKANKVGTAAQGRAVHTQPSRVAGGGSRE